MNPVCGMMSSRTKENISDSDSDSNDSNQRSPSNAVVWTVQGFFFKLCHMFLNAYE